MKKFLTLKWGYVILIVSVILLFIILSVSEGFTSQVLNPVQSFFSSSAVKVKNFFTYFNDIKQIESENESLKEQIAELSLSNLKLENDLENSDIISSEYEYITNHQFSSVLGKVISRGTDNYLQTLIINKGTKDDIQVGYPATIQNGYIIGKVIEANYYNSKILLINDIHSKLSISINNGNKSPGILTGEFGLSLKVDLIPYDHEIETGNMVITSGLEQNIPADLVIGTITSIKKNEGELFQTANVDQLVNVENSKILTIILPADD